MKKTLMLISFFALSYNLLPYTRAELIQERLSKIGIRQEIIDETIKMEYDIKDNKDFYTEEGKENDTFLKLKEIFEKDERNETLGATIAGAYLAGEKKDFNKAREYIDKIAPYSTKFDKMLNEWTFYKMKEDEKNTKKYYNLLQRNYKNSAVIDFIEIMNENMDMLIMINSLNEYFDSNTSDENSAANDLPDGYFYDDKKGVIKDYSSNDGDNDEEGDSDKDLQTYSEGIKEIFEAGDEGRKEEKKQIDKYRRIASYFKIEKNQQEFGIAEDFARGFFLKLAEIEVTNNIINNGVESGVKYYLEKVSNKDVTYDDVYFNEKAELELYISVAQMLAVADESLLNKYRKEFENTRVIRLLDEILKKEREEEKQKKGKTEEKPKNRIKS